MPESRAGRRLAELARQLDRATVVRAGFLSNATYPDGTPVAMVAVIQNYGAPARNIPPRPFFTNMVRDKSREWPRVLAAALKIQHDDSDAALRLLGEHIRGQIQQAIRDFQGAPLAPVTIAAKGFDKQLIDTAHMLNSVDYEVK